MLRLFIYRQGLFHQNPDGESFPIQKTADFLLDNIGNQSGLDVPAYERYADCFTSWLNTDKKVSDLMDSINHSHTYSMNDEPSMVMDIAAVDKKQLWQYILDMHAVVNSPLSRRCIEHADLYEYVLPYRVANEPLNLNWRKEAEEYIKGFKDSVLSDIDRPIPEVANEAMKFWNRTPFKWTDGLPHGGSLGVKCLWIKGGNCRDFGIGATYLMRYFGIPSGIDFLFGRENEGGVHYWPFIIDENGATFFATQDIPYWNPAKEMDLPASKIYRHTFSKHSLTDDLDITPSNIHPKFQNTNILDVTSAYRDTFTVSINVASDKSVKKSIAYLCNAARDIWTPVGIGILDEGKVVFKDVAASSNACIVAIVENEELKPLTRPFVLEDTGETTFFNPAGKSIEAHIYCKYPLSSQNGDVVDRMIGGRIEASNRRDFRDAETLYTVTSSPKRKITKVSVNAKKAYRYLRYIGADSTYCNIAELEIFENGQNENIAPGCPAFGSDGDRTGKGSHLYSNVFDGDLYSSFDYKYPSGGWSAVDLLRPRRITELAYSPRNRDNYIRIGDVYELYYWNEDRKDWVSLGRNVAESDELFYNIPEGALLFLKNHSRGVNERVFEYDAKQDVQIFH